eukprot:2706110-Prymnesium_polylepis.1
MLRIPGWQEEMFVHNVAVLRLGGDEYAMLGGKQGFISESGCRAVRCRAAGSNQTFVRAREGCKIASRPKFGWTAVGWDCVRQGFRHATPLAASTVRMQLECRKPRRDECLAPDQRAESHNGSYAPAVGIRLARGHGLPWDP